ncbi:hypothetical protein EV687_0892 [Corticibacter populi]|nr:hypothetical protein EV687_0892 [Corticibacter populi]
MPGTTNAQGFGAGLRLCQQAHPDGYFVIERGSGKGLFGPKSGDACTVAKSRGTTWAPAAAAINQACQCLYSDGRSAELCDNSVRTAAQLVDPLEHIKRHGYDNVRRGSGNETGTMYSINEKAEPRRVSELTHTISRLDQAKGAAEICTYFGNQGMAASGATSLRLAASGYRGDVIACSLQYTAKSGEKSPQIIFYRENGSEMYMYTVTPIRYLTDEEAGFSGSAQSEQGNRRANPGSQKRYYTDEEMGIPPTPP